MRFDPEIAGWKPHAGWGADGQGIKFNWAGTGPERETGLGWTTTRPPLNETPEQTAQRISDGHETPEEANLRIRRALYESDPDNFSNPDRQSRSDGSGQTGPAGPAAPAAPAPAPPQAQQNVDRARAAFEESVNSFKESAGAFGEAAQREYQVQWGPNGQPTVMVRANGADVWQPDASQNWANTWGQLNNAYSRLNDMDDSDRPTAMRTDYDRAQGTREWSAQQGVMSPAELLNRQRSIIEGQDPIETTITAADEYSAKRMGFDSAAEMEKWIAAARGREVSDMGGLSKSERDLYSQDLHSSTQLMLAQSDRAIDAISGETGSTSRAFAAADQARQQVGDYRIKQNLGMMQSDLQRKQTNFAAEQANLQQMVEQGAITTAQYVDWVHTDRAMTMAEWAGQLSQTLSVHQRHMDVQQQNFDQEFAVKQLNVGIQQQGFEQDRAVLNDYIQNNMSVINADLGMRTAVDAGMDQAYERTMRPYMANIETAMMTLSADTSFYEAVFTEQESQRSFELAEKGIELQEKQLAAQKAQSGMNMMLGFLGMGLKLLTGGLG